MSSQARPLSLRANVYVDGFNLYHGCFDDHRGRAEWRNYRWLDLSAFCTNLFPQYSINRIRYFTALVDPLPGNPDNRTRQLESLRALRTLPNLTIHQGRFATNIKMRPLADPSARPPAAQVPLQIACVLEREEKGSDVNLASYLLVDGFRRDCEVVIVVSNDSDLAEPIRLVRNELGIKVGIVNPRKTVAYDLKDIADFYKSVRVWLLRDSQFPGMMSDANGSIMKPSTW